MESKKVETRANIDFSTMDPETQKMYILEGRPKFRLAYPLSIQHILVMYASNLVPIMIVATAAQVTMDQRIIMLQGALIAAGLATLINCYPIRLGKNVQIGANLPIMMGTSSTFIPPMTAVAAMAVSLGHPNPIGVVIGGLLVAAIAEVFLGAFYRFLKHFLPPVVLGCSLLSVGIMLIGIGINNFGGGAPATNPNFGSLQNMGVAFLVFMIYVLLQRFGKGIWKMAAVLFAMIVGYLVAIPLDMVNFTPIMEASAFALPRPLALGIAFEWWAVGMFVAIYIATGLATIGYTHTITSQAMGRMATNKESAGALFGDVLGTVAALAFNALPNTEFGQNSALVAYSKVISKWVLALASFTLILASFFPHVGAVFASMPPAVIGGGILAVFAFIMTNSLVLIAKDGFTPKKISQLCVTFALGLGFAPPIGAAVPGSFYAVLVQHLPGWLRFITTDRILLMSVVAIIVNLLFMTREEFAAVGKALKEEEVIEYVK